MSGSSNESLLSSLQDLMPENFDIQETPIGDGGISLGWNSTLYLRNGFPFSGGTGASRALARRVAIAEAFERALVDKLFLSEKSRQELLLNEIPSCSGFAAGFNPGKTHTRALYESVERWAWSKWIDGHFMMRKKESPRPLSPLGRLLAKSFVKTEFYEHKVLAEVGTQMSELKFIVFLGFKENGVFPGSRVCPPTEENWDHPLIEASRNYINYEKAKDRQSVFKDEDLIARRSDFFSRNANLALDQIARATKERWPIAPVHLWKRINTGISDVFLSRAVCGDHIPWHLGAVERFVY